MHLHEKLYKVLSSHTCTFVIILLLLTGYINYPFVLAASVAEGDQEEQLEAPTKKQKISKKVQTRVSPQIKRYVQGSPNSSQSPNIFRLKKNQKDISKKYKLEEVT